MKGSGFRFQGSGFRVQGAGFRVQGVRFRLQGSGCRVQVSSTRLDGGVDGLGVWGLRFSVQGVWEDLSTLRVLR